MTMGTPILFKWSWLGSLARTIRRRDGQRPDSSLLPIRKLPEPIGLVPNKVTNLDIKMRLQGIGYIATGRQ